MRARRTRSVKVQAQGSHRVIEKSWRVRPARRVLVHSALQTATEQDNAQPILQEKGDRDQKGTDGSSRLIALLPDRYGHRPPTHRVLAQSARHPTIARLAGRRCDPARCVLRKLKAPNKHSNCRAAPRRLDALLRRACSPADPNGVWFHSYNRGGG